MNVILDLIATFARIGAFSFGGGYAMLPLIREETVELHGWLTSGRLLEFVGISQSTPGPIAINLATFIGYQQAGFGGSLAATLAVSIPSFLMAYGLWQLKRRGSGLPGLDAVFTGVRPAAVGLIAGVCFTLGVDAVRNPLQLAICLATFGLCVKTRIKSGLILAAAAAVGILLTWSGLMGGLG